MTNPSDTVELDAEGLATLAGNIRGLVQGLKTAARVSSSCQDTFDVGLRHLNNAAKAFESASKRSKE